MQRTKVTQIYNLPVETFEKAEEIFKAETKNNVVLSAQYSTKKNKRDKIKYLRFMGYLVAPKG